MQTPQACQAEGTGGRRRFGGLLWQRDFRLLWTGETVSQLGNTTAVVAMPLLAILVLHSSTFLVGALTAAAYLPWLLIGLPAGAWVDRLDRRRLMVVCDLASAVLYSRQTNWLRATRNCKPVRPLRRSVVLA
jgi:hypothetical protein